MAAQAVSPMPDSVGAFLVVACIAARQELHTSNTEEIVAWIDPIIPPTVRRALGPDGLRRLVVAVLGDGADEVTEEARH